jgi:hypothetical protein
MSKSDEMRRVREAQYARQQQQTPSTGARTKIAPTAAPSAERTKASDDAAEGRCAVCGKARALSNGLVSNHQKGFGKMCPGSRKEPA